MSAPAITTTAAFTPPMARRRAHVERYGLWQLRDYAIGRGLPTFLVLAMFGALALVPMLKSISMRLEHLPPHFRDQMIAKHGSLAAFQQSMVHDAGTTFLHGFLGTAVFLGAVLATSGLVANDRKNGYYRFLFSKPLSPAHYYAQAWVLHSAGFLVVASLLAVLYGAYVEPVLTPSFLLGIATVFVMYAGIGFLMTTIIKWDWLGLAGLGIAAQVLWDRFGKSDSIAAKLLYLLPPVHRTGEVYGALVGGTALPWPAMEWIAAYGAVCVLAGLVVLRTQRLAIP